MSDYLVCDKCHDETDQLVEVTQRSLYGKLLKQFWCLQCLLARAKEPK